ncbi:DUF4367 domain-containing protein [Sedimentibacter sp.]|uniref:DUF4367 domain-containing protein n=1 Tax=Sedimentibacter sp. TaxID=1960295 RepID=UPI0028A15D63|nr:DUF4367 domain-containing protein [Sedimentibacter sp.]
MKQMSNENFSNEKIDFLIKKAVMSSIEKDTEIFDMFDKDTTTVNLNKEELDKKIYTMIDEHFDKVETNHAKKNKFRKLIIKVAVFVLILSSGFIIPFITVNAFREMVINFYIENFDTHTSFVPKEEYTSYSSFNIDYLPEGYVASDESKTSNSQSQIFYDNENNIIKISLYDDTTSFNIDTEKSQTYNVLIRNKNGYIFRKESSVILVFKFNDNSIVITSDDTLMSNEELIKIAKSIK